MVAVADGFYAIHINGMGMNEDGSNTGLERLRSVTNNPERFQWRLIWNDNQKDELVDMYSQKKNEDQLNQTFSDYTNQRMQEAGVSYAVGSPEYLQFQDSIREEYKNRILAIGGKNIRAVIAEFETIVPFANGLDYLANIQDFVILLPHSQGNLYANGLYNFLIASKFDVNHISIFGFGSVNNAELGLADKPTEFSSKFRDNQNYVTSKHDEQVASVRFLYKDTLLSNITIDRTRADLTGHSLTAVYLADTATKERFNAYMDEFYNFSVGINPLGAR